MQSSIELLDAIKRRHKLTSDYQLAKLLGIATQRISHYRAGRRHAFSEALALKVAQLLDLSPGYVLAIVSAERAQEADVKRAWERAAKVLAGATLAILAGCSLALAPLPHFIQDAAAQGVTTVYYVKLFLLLLATLGMKVATTQPAREH